MKIERCMLLGGPAHGEIVDIEDGADYYTVPCHKKINMKASFTTEGLDKLIEIITIIYLRDSQNSTFFFYEETAND